MIVTRQRKKPFPWRRLILPIVALGLVVFAFIWGPSRSVITAGPMAPVWAVIGNAYNNVTVPFRWAAQNQEITTRGQRIKELENSNTVQANKLADDEAKIKALTAQVQQLQTNAASASSGTSPAPATSAAPSTGGNATSGGFNSASSGGSDLSQGATPDMRRTASVWANMEPENAAKVIQKQPLAYAARILALMPPDTVGAIMDALPAEYAAKLTQDHPELKR